MTIITFKICCFQAVTVLYKTITAELYDLFLSQYRYTFFIQNKPSKNVVWLIDHGINKIKKKCDNL